MSPLLLYCVVAQVINAITSFSLGFYVLAKNPRSVTNRTFAAFAICVGFWGASYIPWVLATEANLSLFWLRMLMVGCIPVPVFFFHFVVSLLDINSQKRRILRVSYALTFLLLFSIPTPLLVTGIVPKMGFHFWPNGGLSFAVYIIYFVTYLLYAHLLMYQELKKTSGNRRNQIKYLLLGTIPASIGAFTNFFLWYDVPIPPIGNALVAAYVAMAAYAILQHRLMDISIVVRKSLVYSLLVTLLTAGYFGLIYAVERILQMTLGYRTIWVSVATFALMTLAFQPLKVGIQRLVDRLIFRTSQEGLAKMIERLEEEARQAEKFKAVATLAAGMAHEIKNPLTTLKTFTEYIPEKKNDPAFLQKLHEVYTAEVNRIQTIVKDLLEFSKPRPPELKPVDIGPLIVSTVNLLSGDLLHRRVQWTIDCQHNGSILQADVGQLRQILINLIQNAADAMPSGGQLTLSTHSVNNHIELAISDTGSGIPPALLPKIFDPFVTTKPDGNGLGLAVVYSIIQAHHGSIRADSQPGRGTTFTVSLPI